MGGCTPISAGCGRQSGAGDLHETLEAISISRISLMQEFPAEERNPWH